ncbi:MAG TPA: HD domain-containing phosphohydrolase [Candidatus Paceibacterota bacterium]|jgi:putative nucleotidyltransferase with HDIG domain|nr:HD domain-containing phosphohydrolase [Candidatus Paceibacterota bacterium]
MANKGNRSFSNGLHFYIFLVAACGALAVSVSVVDLLKQVPEYRSQWLWLVGLTVLSGLLPVSLPTVNVSISISETFVIAGTLLFGRSGGTVLVLLDALFISLYLFWIRRLKWQQILFNLAAPPLSIWLAATIAAVDPLFRTAPAFGVVFIVQVTAFSSLYFLINTWLVAIAVAIQQRARIKISTWWDHFREVLVNYAAGGSIAALLVYNTREVRPEFVFAIVPLLILLFLTYRWSNKRIEVERERNIELNRVFLSTVEALALAIDAKDQVTHGHIRRVQRYTMALAEALGIKDEKQLDAIRAAALLHDTGKLAVPEYILNKPGPLTPPEYERMKVHATVGADILKSINFPYPVEPIVRHHHENWNGSGYPAGLKGQAIPLGARILSVVDCYDALTSDRPYRPRYSREHAEHVLRERRGSWYDPWVVDEFLRILDQLERMDAEEARDNASTTQQTTIAPAQLEVIAATTAEEREFNELRRELPLANSVSAAADILFAHIRRVIPAATLALFIPSETNDLAAIACTGIGTSAVTDLRIPVGDRISGWALAHKQAVVNSNAALELGPVARTFATPLRYALAVPILNGPSEALGVVTCYGSEPFDNDHRRMLESAATLFGSSTWATGRVQTAQAPQADSRVSRVH